MTKEDNKDCKNSTKCWLCNNNSCHISQPKKLGFPSYYAKTKQIQSENKRCTKWIRKILYTTNMLYTTNNKLRFIDGFQFLH